MSYLSRVLSPASPQATHWARDSAYWVTEEGMAVAASGVNASPDAALTLRAVYRCVALLAGVAASLPLIIYRRLGDREKERAHNHPLSRMFGGGSGYGDLGPNHQQTGFGWVQIVVAHLELRGNSYHRIIASPRGQIDGLVPLHPARVTPEANNQDGMGWVDAKGATLTEHTRMRYVVTGHGGGRETLTEDEVFHIRGLSSNGLMGLSRVALMRESVGLSLATEGYGARFFSQNASPRGVYEVPGKLDNEAYERLKKQVDSEAGLANAHRTKILEQGAKWSAVGLSNEDSQFLETRAFQVADIAGWFGVPPHLIGDVERSTSWGTGLAEQNLALLTFTVAPILTCIEQAIAKELILADRTYFVEFLVDALLRTDPKTRAEALAVKRQNGIINADEWRRLDNDNPIGGPEGEAYLVNGNMISVSRALAAPAPPAVPPPANEREDNEDPPEPTPEPASTPAPAPSLTEANSRATLIVQATAAQLVRKEVRWVQTWAPRLAKDGAAWRAKVAAFYEKHAETVAERLRLGAEDAGRYCAAQMEALTSGGLADAGEWETTATPRLVAMATGPN